MEVVVYRGTFRFRDTGYTLEKMESQSKDIAAAKRYWDDFREVKRGKAQ